MSTSGVGRGSRRKILDFMLSKLGRVVEADEIRSASGNVSEWGRRLRELRDEYGYQILSHRDRADLKPGQYLLETDVQIPSFTRAISKETRAIVLERNGYTCQMCGAAAGDPDPLTESRKTRLTIGHIVDKSKGGDDSLSNLRAMCASCNEGLQNIGPQKPSRIQLITQVRRATIDDQRYVMDWLSRKFEGH